MADNNNELDPSALSAQKEFDVILDALLVPLKADVSDQKLPFRRRWRGGCLLKRPDLVPVNPDPDDGPEGFCNTDGQGRLIVTVKNQGDADATSSVTSVTYSHGVSESVQTDPIDAGDTREVTMTRPIPGDCFTDDLCKFQIIVDANNSVVEFDKANNTASGQCSRGNDVE
jgi:hypothetical protein